MAKKKDRVPTPKPATPNDNAVASSPAAPPPSPKNLKTVGVALDAVSKATPGFIHLAELFGGGKATSAEKRDAVINQLGILAGVGARAAIANNPAYAPYAAAFGQVVDAHVDVQNAAGTMPSVPTQ